MGWPNTPEVLLDPNPGDSMSSPSHAVDEHQKENHLLAGLQTLWLSRNGTVPSIVNLRSAAAGDATTDDTAAIQSVINAMPNEGGIILVPNNRYRVVSTIDCVNKAALWFLGMGGKRYVGPTTGAAAQLHGAAFQAATAGMTMFKFRTDGAAPNRAEALNAGPQFHNLSFEDPRVLQTQKNITAATTSGSVATFTIGTHPFQIGDSIHVRDTYPADSSTTYIGVFTVTGISGTTVSANVGAAASGPATSFGQLSYETMPGAIAPSATMLSLEGQSRAAWVNCLFYGALVGVKIQPASGADDDYCLFDHSSFVWCGTGVQHVGAASGQGSVFRACDSIVEANQTAVDFLAKGSRAAVAGFRMRTGDSTSGQNAIGINVRVGSDVVIEDAVGDMDIRLGNAWLIKMGSAGSVRGSIIAPHLTGSTIDSARRGIGVQVDGLDASNTSAVSIHGGSYSDVHNAVILGQFSKGSSVHGGFYSRYDVGIQVNAGATGTVIIAPGAGTRIGSSPLVSDLGTGTIRLGSADGGAAYGGLYLPSQVAPPVPAAGHAELFLDQGSGAVSVKKADNTVVSLEGGGGGSGAGGLVLRNRLLNTVPITANGDTIILSYTVPANQVAGFTWRILAWGFSVSDANPQPVMAPKLVIVSSVRNSFNWTIPISQTQVGWRCQSDGLIRSFFGTGNSGGVMNSNLWGFNSAVSGVASSKTDTSGAYNVGNAISAGFDLTFTINLSLAAPVGDVLTAEGCEIWTT